MNIRLMYKMSVIPNVLLVDGSWKSSVHENYQSNSRKQANTRELLDYVLDRVYSIMYRLRILKKYQHSNRLSRSGT